MIHGGVVDDVCRITTAKLESHLQRSDIFTITPSAPIVWVVGVSCGGVIIQPIAPRYFYVRFETSRLPNLGDTMHFRLVCFLFLGKCPGPTWFETVVVRKNAAQFGVDSLNRLQIWW